ncbi:MAG: hypothetical protein IJM57_02835 [Lachnospiraceae bacterium]|nr:hypothetical protein [Lachnospiraceae bacterium]
MNGSVLFAAIGFIVLREYVLIALSLVVMWVVLPLLLITLAEHFDRKRENKNQFGIGMLFAVMIPILNAIIATLVLVVNPIRILIKYRALLAGIAPLWQRIGWIVLVLLPVPGVLLFIFPTALSNFLFRMKYERAKGRYRVAPEQYKTPAEFRDELVRRRLYFEEERDRPVYDRMLRKYRSNREFSGYCLKNGYYYTPASMMPLDGKTFYDDYVEERIINPDSSEPKPAYIYNAVIALNEESGKLEYMPLGRYDKKGSLNGNFFPLFKDFYIECKILDVNGDIYAILGVGECFAITDCLGIGHLERPFYMVVAEKDSITTFIEDEYFPDGAIEQGHGRIEMAMNTVKKSWVENYPVRRVERLDADALNRIAAELQEGELKECLEHYFDRNREREDTI